ncbi:MAG: DUF6584 family protein [Myxococcota bacterium]
MDTSVRDVMERVEVELNRGELEAAGALLRQAQTAFPEEIVLGVRLAEVYRAQGLESEAWESYASSALRYAATGQLAFATALYKLMMSLEHAPQRVREDEQREFRRQLVHAYTTRKTEQPSEMEHSLEIQLFQDLPREALEVLMQRLVAHQLSPSTPVFRQGDPSSSLFIITHGFVQVSHAREDGTERDIARLGPGDFFGEWGLLSGERVRHASVRAMTDVSLLELNRETLAALIARYPSVRDVMSAFYRRRRLDTLLAQVFPALQPTERRRLAEQMERDIPYAQGDIIIYEGDTSAYLSIIASGTVEVLTHNLDGQEIPLAQLEVGQYFGEGSALTGHPRIATVRAKTDVMLHNIAREALVTTLVNRPEILLSLQGVRQERLEATLERIQEMDDFSFDFTPASDEYPVEDVS